jgi:hypothetical protein
MLHHLPVAAVKFVHKSDLHKMCHPSTARKSHLLETKIRSGNEDLIQATKKNQW